MRRRNNMKKEIEYDNFKNAIYHTIDKWFKTDITDYDNWVGVGEFADAIWNLCDTNKMEKISDDIKQISKTSPPKYKKVFGKYYKQITN